MLSLAATAFICRQQTGQTFQAVKSDSRRCTKHIEPIMCTANTARALLSEEDFRPTPEGFWRRTWEQVRGVLILLACMGLRTERLTLLCVPPCRRNMTARAVSLVGAYVICTSFLLMLGFYAGRLDLQKAAETARCVKLAHSNARAARLDTRVQDGSHKPDANSEEQIRQPRHLQVNFTRSDSTGAGAEADTRASVPHRGVQRIHRARQQVDYKNVETLPTYLQVSFSSVDDLEAAPDTSKNTVWLYSLIATDHDDFSLIPHFLRHYNNAGVSLRHFFLDLVHDPALSNAGLLKAQQFLTSAGAQTRTILQPYTPALQDQAMLSGLYMIPMHVEDWVIVTDQDEFYTFGEGGVAAAVKSMDTQGATFALGEILDHVARGGKLKEVDNRTDIWSQFPLKCPIVSAVGKGLAAKVTLAKAYLRTGAGHQHIVEPHLAYAYFSSDCTGIDCELVMKRYKQRTLRDLYNLTPYYQYADRYVISGTGNTSGWRSKQWSVLTKIHHFKWHAAVLDNMLDRMARDNGDCLLGVNEDSCDPVFQFWKEIALEFHAFNATQSVNISALGCNEDVDTLWDWQ